MYRKAFIIFLFSLLLPSLAACSTTPSPAVSSTPAPTVSATPGAASISARTAASLALEKTLGSGDVQAGVWSPDGKTLALATSVRIDLYDDASFKRTGEFDTGLSTEALAYSPDGKLLAAGGTDGTIQLWDTGQKRLLQTLGGGQSLNYGTRLVFSPDGEKLIASGGQTIHIWAIPSGRPVDTYAGYVDGVLGLAVSLDGNVLLAASSSQITVTNLSTHTALYAPLTLPASTESIAAIFIAPGGKDFVTVSSDTIAQDHYQTMIRTWDLAGGTMLHENDAQADRVSAAALSPDGRWVALSNGTGVVLWKTSDPITGSYYPADHPTTLAFSPAGFRLFTGGGRPQVWDLASTRNLKTFDDYSGTLARAVFSPDGKLVATAGGNIQVRELAGDRVRYTLEGGAPLVFSPDGTKLAFASSKDSIGLVDAATGKALWQGIACPGLAALAFSPDGRSLAYGGDGCMVTLSDLHSGQIVNALGRAQDNDGRTYVENLVFSPDGRRLVVAGHYTVETWDLKSGTLLQTINGLNNDTQVAYSPDGRWLAVSGFGGYSDHAAVQIWDAMQYRLIFVLTTLQHQISKLAFSPDGQLLAAGGENTYSDAALKLELWDAWSGQPLSRIEETTDMIAGLGFSADGRTLLSARSDGAIHLWHAGLAAVAGLAVRPTPTRFPTLAPTSPAVPITISKTMDLGKGFSSRYYHSADGKLAAHFEGSVLKWYQAAGMTPLGSIDINADFYSDVTFSPDDKLAVVDVEFGAQIIDLATQSVVGKLSGGNGATNGYTFSRDGKYLAYLMEDSTSGGPYEAIGLWDATRRQALSPDDGYFPTLMMDRYHTMSFPAISPDDKLVAAGHSDNRVYVWNLADGKTRFVLEGHAQDVTTVDFSPDGRFLASGSSDGTIRLWNPASGKLVRVLTGFHAGIRTLRFSSDGQALYVDTDGSEPEQIYGLRDNQIAAAAIPQPTPDPLEAQQYNQGFSDGYYSRVLFSPDGRTLALTGQNVWLWDAGAGSLLRYIDTSAWGGVDQLAFSPDSRQMAISTSGNMLLVLDPANGQPVLALQGRLVNGQVVYASVPASAARSAGNTLAPSAKGPAFSPDGSLLAFGNGAGIEVWDIAKAARLLALDGGRPTSTVRQLSFSPDGKHLYAVLDVESATALQAWDLGSGKLLRTIDLPDPTSYVYGGSAMRGPLFARSDADDNSSWFELWNIETGQSHRLPTPTGQTQPMEFSPDGSLLLAEIDGKFNFWQTGSGQLVYQTQADFSGVYADISPDNRTLAVARNDKGELWDIGQIAQQAQQMAAVPAPPAAPTPAVVAWPTPTPGPTATLPAGSGTLSERVITRANAAQVKQLSRFGQGTIEQAIWSPSGTSIMAAGSLGIFQYDGSLVETARRETDGWNYDIVVLAADGQVLAAGVNAGQVQVQDMATGQILADVPGGGKPALSPDGQLLVYQNQDKNLAVWDVAGRQPVSTLQLDSGYSSYKSGRPIFSPDGKLVAAVIDASRYNNAVRVWDARTGVIVNALGGPDNDITDLAFSADGRYVVGAAGGSAWIWQMRPGAPVDSIELYKGTISYNLTLFDHTVTAAGISPDDRTIAVGTSERVIWLYDRHSHAPVRKLEGDAAAARLLRFSPDGKSLLSVDADGLLQIWDPATGRALASSAVHTGSFGGLVFRQDGNLTAWGTGNAWVVRPGDGQLLQTTQVHGGTILAASPAGDWLAVYDPYRVSLWDARSGAFKQTLEGEADEATNDYHLEGMILRQFYGASFSPDGSRLATGGTGGVWLYDTKNDGRLLQQFPGTDSRKLVFSPDGSRLMTSLFELEDPPEILDLQSGKNLFSPADAGYGYDFHYGFSPDGRMAGILSQNRDEDYQLNLWELASQQLVRTVDFGKDTPVISLAFNPAGSLIALGRGDGRIVLLSLTDYTIVATLDGHRGTTDHLVFSPDGRSLASTGQDGTVRIWGIQP